MNFLLSRKAHDDLKNIARFTQKQWGKAQRDTYLQQIDNAFREIEHNHQLGISCDYIREGYYKFIIGKHIIFYTSDNKNKILIVRILHGSMDVERHL